MLQVIKSLLFSILLLSFASCKQGQKTQRYTIGLDPQWYPLELAGQEKNVMAFTIELLVHIAKKENLELSVVSMNWNNLLEGLRKHQYDGALSALRNYTFNRDKYAFSQLYLMSGPVLVVPDPSKIQNLDQVAGKEVGLIPRSTATLLLQKYPGIILRAYDSIPLALEAIVKEQVDVGVLDVLITQKYIRNLWHDQLKIATMPLTDEGMRLLTLKEENPILMQRFDRGLKAIKKNGQYKKLLDKWGLSPDGKEVKGIDAKLQALLFELQGH